MKAFRKAGIQDGGVCVVLEEHENGSASTLKVREDISMVDGLGGGVWDGSLLLCDLIKDWLRPRPAQAAPSTPFESSSAGLATSNLNASTSVTVEGESAYVVELGGGTGLLGMVAYATNSDVDVLITDRYSDLLTENIEDLNHRSNLGVETSSSIQRAMRNELFMNGHHNNVNEFKEALSKSEWGDGNTDMGGSNASPKRNRSPTSTDAQEKSPSEEQPRKRHNSMAERKHGGEDKSERGETRKGKLTAESLTWTVKNKSDSGFNPSPTAEEMTVLYTPLPGSTYANTPRYPDLILGAEIAVLQKQQAALVSTISRLAGPKTLVLITVDDLPAYPARSKYERNLDESFRKSGFLKIVLSAGRVRWTEIDISHSSSLVDEEDGAVARSDEKHGHDAKGVLPPPPTETKRIKTAYIDYVPLDTSKNLPRSNVNGGFAVTLASHQQTKTMDALSDSLQRLPLDSPPPLPGENDERGAQAKASPGGGSNDDLDSHHVNGYFKPSLLSTCARCHNQFINNSRLFNNPHCGLLNPHMVCRYHPQYYEAKFWDCCGAEEENAPGCVKGVHMSY